MKIAAIGSGHIGGTLGKRWAAQGHQVMFGSRDPHSAKIQALLQEAGANAQADTVSKAIAYGEVISAGRSPRRSRTHPGRSGESEQQDSDQLHQPLRRVIR